MRKEKDYLLIVEKKSEFSSLFHLLCTQCHPKEQVEDVFFFLSFIFDGNDDDDDDCYYYFCISVIRLKSREKKEKVVRNYFVTNATNVDQIIEQIFAYKTLENEEKIFEKKEK